MEHTNKLYVYPYMSELPAIIRDMFKNILRVGYEIPRLEFVMSNGGKLNANVYYYAASW